MLSDVAVLDTEAMTWTRREASGHARCAAAVGRDGNGRMVLFGGFTGNEVRRVPIYAKYEICG